MTEQPIAIALRDAPKYVPFSYDYLYRAVKRTDGNPLRARKAGGKYVVELKNLTTWIQKEGDEA